jgi:hypothetical protein
MLHFTQVFIPSDFQGIRTLWVTGLDESFIKGVRKPGEVAGAAINWK